MWVECAFCGGNGKDPNIKLVINSCPCCKGKGRQNIRRYKYTDAFECIYCKGTGVDPKSGKEKIYCKPCHGAGVKAS